MSREQAPIDRTARRRWRFQYRLRSLLVFTTVFAFLLGWWTSRARRQWEIMNLIWDSGGTLSVTPRGTGIERTVWLSKEPLRRFLPIEYVDNLDGVCFESVTPPVAVLARLRDVPGGLRDLMLNEAGVGDAHLSCVSAIDSLEHLEITGTEISDEGLEMVGRLRSLTALILYHCKLSDAGLAELTSLDQLKSLDLRWTPVTDSGLVHLRAFRQLKFLSLGHTRITGNGLKELTPLTQLRSLELTGDRISDRDLEHLEGLPQLHGLFLDNTDVSDAGLEHLKGLGELRQLTLAGSRVTKRGVTDLQKALPTCCITW